MSAYSDLILATSGLLAYWRLGDASGAAVDSKGSLNGTVTGATYGVTGAITGDADKAYSFAGAGTVKITNDALLQLDTGTIELWFKATTGDAFILSKHNAWNIYLNGTNLAFYVAGVGMKDSGVAVTDGNWHHAALVFDSGVSNGTTLYLDGVGVKTDTLTVLSHFTSGVVIGATRDDTPESYFTGSIDEVALYSSKLSGATITAHYTLGVNGPPTSSSRINTQFQLRPY